jgi:hypothetical protein
LRTQPPYHPLEAWKITLLAVTVLDVSVCLSTPAANGRLISDNMATVTNKRKVLSFEEKVKLIGQIDNEEKRKLTCV